MIAQAGELFLVGPASAGQALLLQTASDDMSSSELLFSPLPGQDHSKEADAWQVSTCVPSTVLMQSLHLYDMLKSSAMDHWQHSYKVYKCMCVSGAA